MKYYLLSGPLKEGGFPDTIKEYLKNDLKNVKKIVLIPTRKDNYLKNDEYKNRISRDINKIKTINNIILLDNRNISKSEEIFKDVDLVYLLGGNPIDQLSLIKDYDIAKYIKNAPLVIGTSAGALNMCKYSYYSKDMDIDESFFYKGLSLVDISIDVHFDIDNKEQVNEFVKYNKIHKLYGIPDDGGIILDNNKILLIGDIYQI
jgi:peptidase E